MSYSTARAQVISILEGITPSSVALFSAGFKQRAVEATGPATTPKPRAFTLEAAIDGDAAILGPYTPDIGHQPRISVVMALTVYYRDFPNQRPLLDEVLLSDWLDIAQALGTPSNYSSTTTGLLAITSSPAFFPMRRTYPEAGDVVQRITFPMLCR